MLIGARHQGEASMTMRARAVGILSLTTALTLSVTLGAVPALAVDDLAGGLTDGSAVPEVVATVDDAPYQYDSQEDYATYSSTPPAAITPATTLLRLELSDRFLYGASDVITWDLPFLDMFGGTAAIDRTSRSVDIPLPAGFYPAAASRGSTEVLFNLASRGRPAGLPETVPPRFVNSGSGWTSRASYTLSLRSPAPANPKTTLAVTLANLDDGDPMLRRNYWATVDDDAVIDARTTLRFQATTPLWQPMSGWNGVPVSYIERPWLEQNPQGQVAATAGRPIVAPDSASIALPFSELPGVLDSVRDRTALLKITAAVADTGRTGTYVSVVAPVGSTTSMEGTRTTRLAGPDRYDGSVINAIVANPHKPPVVYLASGKVFADALSAGPAAVRNGGQLLLISEQTRLSTSNYLAWLQPDEIVVMGGQASTSDAAVDSLLRQAGLDPNSYSLRRNSGSDRYAASLAISQNEFSAGAETAFIASGTGFADALTSIPAAATGGSPLILVRGDRPRLDESTFAELHRLGVSRVVIAGGPASVSTGIEAQLGQRYPGGVTRFGGATRFEVAVSLNAAFFPTTETAYIATGATFPDALTGGVLAGVNGAPLVLARTECVPASTWQQLAEWMPGKVTLLGGVNTLGSDMRSLPLCA
jgi:putative cell wall-binding protein